MENSNRARTDEVSADHEPEGSPSARRVRCGTDLLTGPRWARSGWNRTSRPTWTAWPNHSAGRLGPRAHCWRAVPPRKIDIAPLDIGRYQRDLYPVADVQPVGTMHQLALHGRPQDAAVPAPSAPPGDYSTPAGLCSFSLSGSTPSTPRTASVDTETVTTLDARPFPPSRLRPRTAHQRGTFPRQP